MARRTRRNPKAGVKTGVVLGVAGALVGLHVLCREVGKHMGYTDDSQVAGPFGAVKRRKASPASPAAFGG